MSTRRGRGGRLGMVLGHGGRLPVVAALVRRHAPAPRRLARASRRRRAASARLRRPLAPVLLGERGPVPAAGPRTLDHDGRCRPGLHGISLRAIAENFGVDDHTAAKALRWFRER